MLLYLAAVSANAVATAPPAAAIRDTRMISRETAAPAPPVPPRGLVTDDKAPEVELALLDPAVGPVLRIGAFGGRNAAAPKLAHVAIGWRF
ncbi:hypothetical protein [Qipengyuania sediminis]|uniref:hypothetical protein n=1 Tax=Qipengyuania sediminis TaxID=1532023 RepID=UPI001404D2FB|nr:hypothetical protein [Qipengyuania sediminis]